MGSTSNYAWPYPDAGASNNVPSDMAALAAAADGSLKTVHDDVLAAIPAIDGTTADITASAPGDTKAAGSTGKTADAGHQHGREVGPATHAGSTGADVPVSTSSFGVVLTTASLAVGTWLIDATIQFESGSNAGTATASVGIGTGTETAIAGRPTGEASLAANAFGSVHLNVLITVSVAGTFTVTAEASATGIVAKQIVSGGAGASGYTALKVA